MLVSEQGSPLQSPCGQQESERLPLTAQLLLFMLIKGLLTYCKREPERGPAWEALPYCTPLSTEAPVMSTVGTHPIPNLSTGPWAMVGPGVTLL